MPVSSRTTAPCSNSASSGQTMHQIDERTSLADLRTLTAIYRKILERYFSAITLWDNPR